MVTFGAELFPSKTPLISTESEVQLDPLIGDVMLMDIGNFSTMLIVN